MKVSGIFFLILTTIILVALTVMAFYEISFYLIFYLTIIGQIFLIYTVYKILTDDYSTKKKFKDWYEDHPIGRKKGK